MTITTNWRDLITFDDNEIYTMVLLMRSKDNKNFEIEPLKSNTALRRIVSKESHIDKYFEELKVIGDSKNLNYNIYINFNPRDLLKSYLKLKHYMLELDRQLFHGDLKCLNKLKRINVTWFSCLNKKGTHKGRKRHFMIDLDSRKLKDYNSTKLFIETNKLELNYEHKSRNGYHLLVSPFDMRLFAEFKKTCGFDIEIKTDNILQIYYNKIGDKK